MYSRLGTGIAQSYRLQATESKIQWLIIQKGFEAPSALCPLPFAICLFPLEEKDSIPMVREQMELIQEIQTNAWWEDVTIPMLERTRKRL